MYLCARAIRRFFSPIRATLPVVKSVMSEGQDETQRNNCFDNDNENYPEETQECFFCVLRFELLQYIPVPNTKIGDVSVGSMIFSAAYQ